MLLRHDNGLVFGSWSFRPVVKDYGLELEYKPTESLLEKAKKEVRSYPLEIMGRNC